jgi:signal transduction histidine kinase/ActR/RegA family two-component response regulator
MKCIASFVDRPPLSSPGATVIAIAELCAGMANVRAFPVAEAGRVVGMIYREAIEVAAHAGDVGQTVGELMIPDPLAIQADAGVAEAAEAMLADPARSSEAFVVLENGEYVGVADLAGLLGRLAAQAPAPHSPQDDERIALAVAEQFHHLMHTVEGEFRGQVHGLLAMTDRLDRQHLSPDAQAQVRSIKATGETLLRLADDALDMLEARQGRLELKAQPQLLRELADDVQDRWTARAAESGVSLLISYDGDPDLSAVIDSGRLVQVFDNLIDNALSYTRQGSVEVSLRARADGDQVMLGGRVRDTGPGLAGAKLARIFDPEGGPPGEGGSLPLSLTRGIILSMKGSIRAESNVGQGMTIVFDMMAPAADAAVPSPVSAYGRHVTGAPHILVVDDNATNRMVAEALCEMFDCTSETVEDGVEAVEAARNGRFDLILMDIKMPRMDGIAATKAIRALGGHVGQVPIVALTANVDPEDARGYLAVGMCAVVEKPIKPDRLLQAINTALASGAEDADGARVAAA